MHEDPTLMQQIYHLYDKFLIVAAMVFAGAFGGLIRYMNNAKSRGAAVSFGEGLLEVASSAFVGVVIGMSVYSYTGDVMLTCAASGTAGHIGARNIFRLVNKWLQAKINQ